MDEIERIRKQLRPGIIEDFHNQNCPALDLDPFESDSGHEENEKVDPHTKCVTGIQKCNKLMMALVSIILAVVCIVSYYAVLIINFTFFISSLISYTMAPIYQGLSQNWTLFAVTMIQVLLNVPYIEFYILFLIKSVKYFVDSFSSFGEFIKCTILYGTYTLSNNRKYKVNKKDISICKQIIRLLLTLLLLAVSIAAIYVLFIIKNMLVILGMIPYAALVIQIIALIFNVYSYCWSIFWHGRINDANVIARAKTNHYFYANFVKYFIAHMDIEILHNEQKKFDKHYGESDSTDSGEFPGIQTTLELHATDSDSDVRDLHTEYNKNVNKSKKDLKFALFDALSALLTSSEYIPVAEFALLIACDKSHPKIKQAIFIFVFLLNLAEIGYDIYESIQVKSTYFYVGIGIRLFFLPVVSLFNIVMNLMFKAIDVVLRIVIYIGTIFTILICVAFILAFIVTGVYADKTRIKSLSVPYEVHIPPISNTSQYHQVCISKITGIPLIDAFGYAMGPYDAGRDDTVFDHEMQYFFGENWSSHIDYSVRMINKQTPFIIYQNHDDNMTVYGFRGFSSGSELALQVEVIIYYYVLPPLQKIAPMYNMFVDNWLDMYASFAHNFGFKFFNSKSMISDFIDPLIKICEEEDVRDNENIIFTGINVGGIIAKLLGNLYKKQSVAFLSFPIYNDLFMYTYNISKELAGYVTNIFTYEGLFSTQEPSAGTNIGIPWVKGPNDFNPSCTANGICDISFEKESVYRSFCTIVEICGKIDQFYGFCNTTITGEDMEAIRNYIEEIF